MKISISWCIDYHTILYVWSECGTTLMSTSYVPRIITAVNASSAAFPFFANLRPMAGGRPPHYGPPRRRPRWEGQARPIGSARATELAGICGRPLSAARGRLAGRGAWPPTALVVTTHRRRAHDTHLDSTFGFESAEWSVRGVSVNHCNAMPL